MDRGMDEDISKFFHDDAAKERPFDCSECRKGVKVLYTEVVEGVISQTIMCQDCPELQRRLYGISKEEADAEVVKGLGLCCGSCGTTLEAIRTGHPLGCQECYEVFKEVILHELLKQGRVPKRFENAKGTLHIGKSKQEYQTTSKTMRLLALNEALSETLENEDYEQAALLRDQIKQLTEEDGNDA